MELTEAQIRAAYAHVTGDLGERAEYSPFEKRIRPTHSALVEVAASKETIEHKPLAKRAETSWWSYLSKLLAGIAFIQHQEGRPPLSVLVVNANTGRPSDRFDDVIERFDLLDEDLPFDEAVEVLTEEVHDYWAERATPTADLS